MSDMDGGIHAVNPALLVPQRINLKGLFNELSKAVVKIGGGTATLSAGAAAHNPIAVAAGWSTIANAFPDVVVALSNVGMLSAEGCAYTLVRKAMLHAVAQLGAETLSIFTESLVAESPFTIVEADEIKLVLAPDFLQHPREVELVRKARPILKRWLIAKGLADIQAHTTAERLPTYFALSLHEELTKYAELYEPLTKTLKADTATIAMEAWLWNRYRAELIREPDRPLFEETFGLRHVFVPLWAAWIEETRADNEEVILEHTGEIKDLIPGWLTQGVKEDTLRVLSGDPGSGKSSCAKMLAAELAEYHPSWRVVFIPLHHFKYRGDVRESLKAYLKDEKRIDADLLDPQCQDSVILFFDGLDELAMQGKTARQAAIEFVRQVDITLLNVNRDRRRVLVVMGGRQLVIQDCRGELHKSHQILNLQPYDGRQRNEWWRKYGKASQRKYTTVPSELNRSDLAELTAQPLLNYLLALSYDRKKLDFTKGVTVNAIYADLLERVYERRWGDGGNVHLRGKNQYLLKDEFIDILEEIGIGVWHADSRSATMEAIRSRCELAGLAAALKKLEDDEDAGVFRLLTAFHVRFKDIREGTVEFTHKSFGEYLAARRIVRMVKSMCEERALRKTSRDRGWDATYALRKWVQLCGPKSLDSTDRNLFNMIVHEISDNHASKRAEWLQHLAELSLEMLTQRLPMQECGISTFGEMDSQARNAEEALLCILYICHSSEDPIVDTYGINATEVINRLRLRTGWGNQWRLDRACVSALWYLGAAFASSNLDGADLEKSNLSEINLYYANLRHANLVEAGLTGAKLSSANLEGSVLKRSTLIDAELNDTNLCRADLEYADLERASLHDANLKGATLQNANLRHAVLFRASLIDADLRDANLEGAILCDADMRGATLYGANCNGADMRGVNLGGATYTKDDLAGARISGDELGNSDADTIILDSDLDATDPFEGMDLHSMGLTDPFKE